MEIKHSELVELINLTVTRTLREMGFRGGDALRVNRHDMVRRIGRKRYDRAVRNGELQTYKNGEARSAGVWAKREDWDSFCLKFCL